MSYKRPSAVEKDQGRQYWSDQVSSFKLGLFKKRGSDKKRGEVEEEGIPIQGTTTSQSTGTENSTHKPFIGEYIYRPKHRVQKRNMKRDEAGKEIWEPDSEELKKILSC